MEFFNLPERTKVGRVVPKNAFDEYINTNQKKLFTNSIQRISWTHKLSSDTLNLIAKNIFEIQVFKIELKQKTEIPKILEIINKSIPYHIVFWIEHNQEAYISTASKHPHSNNDDVAVIDWTFTSDWFNKKDNNYAFNLKGTLDSVFMDFCAQLNGKSALEGESLNSWVKNLQEINRIKNQISKLKLAISRAKQFNEKVELNIKLKEEENTLKKKLSR
jgi:hypothetical protein